MSSPTIDKHAKEFEALLAVLSRVPADRTNSTSGGGFGAGSEDGRWWVKLDIDIDIDHALAWSTVQEFGIVLNYLSLDERLPTVSMPVSPTLYLNG